MNIVFHLYVVCELLVVLHIYSLRPNTFHNKMNLEEKIEEKHAEQLTIYQVQHVI
jgi:hypothetical protein